MACLVYKKNGDNNYGGQPTPNEAQSPARNLGQGYYGDGGIFGTNLKKKKRPEKNRLSPIERILKMQEKQ